MVEVEFEFEVGVEIGAEVVVEVAVQEGGGVVAQLPAGNPSSACTASQSCCFLHSKGN